ncbi:glycosyltransferase [Peribacillus frigoritolerans]|uniref:glycosyltransferase n=1 Tax=Peribacillus frigoritolerans TaxID=450367 RepID=UPI002B247DDA|nr:glycosyltransferase [Peribacillus frigoritolerans]MEB2492992.1 glycosyltransferase [Peribacillus frigoritolerans]
MNIMVFDVPAESGGALSVLNDFYKEATLFEDKGINWIFVVSKPQLKETDNIKVLRFPWVKKSWWHRIYFDNILAPRLIKEYNVDKVLSLHNVIVPHIKSYQILYVHNSLPFVDYKFSLKENKLLWVYQNIISRNIIRSIKKSDKVIVQTKWMKKACIEKTRVESKKINVLPPQINVDINNFFKADDASLSTFFYPASSMDFKNHKVIVDACKYLKNKNINDFKVIFSLKGNETDNISKLYKESQDQNLPIDFVGNLTREQVFDLYTKSILVFPSFVESSPLPLTEAKLHHSIVIASDYSFSHEILDDYKNAYFFDAFNSNELAELIDKVLHQRIKYYSCTIKDKKADSQKLIDFIVNENQ